MKNFIKTRETVKILWKYFINHPEMHGPGDIDETADFFTCKVCRIVSNKGRYYALIKVTHEVTGEVSKPVMDGYTGLVDIMQLFHWATYIMDYKYFGVLTEFWNNCTQCVELSNAR